MAKRAEGRSDVGREDRGRQEPLLIHGWESGLFLTQQEANSPTSWSVRSNDRSFSMSRICAFVAKAIILVSFPLGSTSAVSRLLKPPT